MLYYDTLTSLQNLISSILSYPVDVGISYSPNELSYTIAIHDSSSRALLYSFQVHSLDTSIKTIIRQFKDQHPEALI